MSFLPTQSQNGRKEMKRKKKKKSIFSETDETTDARFVGNSLADKMDLLLEVDIICTLYGSLLA